jgi:hypothetical protein
MPGGIVARQEDEFTDILLDTARIELCHRPGLFPEIRGRLFGAYCAGSLLCCC